MKSILKKIFKKLLQSFIVLLRKQPRLKQAALAALYKVPRLKSMVFKTLTAQAPKKAELAQLDRWGQTIHASLEFQMREHKRRRTTR